MEPAERSVRTTIQLLRTANTWNAQSIRTGLLLSSYSLA